MSNLSILHFNDVYRVTPQKLSPTSTETVDVTQFAALVDDLRDQWPKRSDGKRDGLVLFSGDLFSPSVESSVTRGSHMVPVINDIAPDVSLTGNHDFDFGYPHLSKLVQDTKFPWVLSNIIDETTSRVPEHLNEFSILERGGLRIGIIGLVEEEWIATVASWPATFKYKSMTETGLDLSKRLRDPQGGYRCDLIVALTHSRIPNDISLAKELCALSPSARRTVDISKRHGVDLLLGGHDHLYFVSKGVNSWENYDIDQEVLGAEEDEGHVLVIKSGTDFRDLSELTLDVESTPEGSIRNKVIQRITGCRHSIQASLRSSETMAKLLKTILSSVSSTLKAPVCKTTVPIDVRSQLIRTDETAAANWFADVIRHVYDEALCMKGCGGADAVFICAGTLRGDSVYGPGVMTLGNILEVLPFEDPIVVLEVDGAVLWDALEASLSTWPAQEGRFPVVSGMKVSWDSRKEPGQRVLRLWLIVDSEGNNTPSEDTSSTLDLEVELEPIKREKGGRKYKIVTRDYMAEGHDGFVAFKGQKYLVDHESGHLMSSIVRKYLLGSHFVNKMARLQDQKSFDGLQSATQVAVLHEQNRRRNEGHTETKSTAVNQWKHAADLAIQRIRSLRSNGHYRNTMNVSATEHMSPVDVFDGQKARKGEKTGSRETEGSDDDLLVISPVVDGRLKDVGRH
ncbi:Metallo-dependent phosphatase-like protein [Crucibulum laeve]|uniref:Metallo-dependent phosphatase-like protein n=1 Tax=Crucibulum laeve TaxID=68775 RepID=A0A5C3MC63_9AGAR|nr:Metallo-dependent phosphatase-like protein [Crucibulum laeve]